MPELERIDIAARNVLAAKLPELIPGIDDAMVETLRKSGLLPGIAPKQKSFSIGELILIRTAAELYGIGLKLPIVAGLMTGIMAEEHGLRPFDLKILDWIKGDESPKLILLLENRTDWSNDWNDIEDVPTYQGARIIVPFSRYCEDIFVGLGLVDRVKSFREIQPILKESRRRIKLISCPICGEKLVRRERFSPDHDISYRCQRDDFGFDPLPCAHCGGDMLPLDAPDETVEIEKRMDAVRFSCYDCGRGEMYQDAIKLMLINALRLKSNADAAIENDERIFEVVS